MSELIPTLLPEPVVPAISRCGIARRSSTTGSPWMSLPRASVSGEGECWNRSDSMTSRMAMISPPPGLGTSMPTLARPGSRSTRIDSAESASARSSERFMTWLTLMPAAGRNSYVVTTGPGWYSAISPSTPNSAHLAAISRPSRPAPCGRSRPDSARSSSSETGGQGVAVERERQALLRLGLLLRRGHGRLRRDRTTACVFLIENLPGPGTSRTIGGASSGANGMSSSDTGSFFAFSRCLVTTVRRSRSLVRRSRCRTQPTVSRPSNPAKRTRSFRKTSPSETCVASGTASSTSVIARSTAPVVPIRPRNDVGERAPDEAAGLHVLAVELAPAERERQEHRHGEDEQHQAGGLRARVRQRARPEPPPAEHEEQGRHAPRRQAEERVQRRRERGPEAADPVVRAAGLASRGPRKDVRIVRIVRKQGEDGQERRRAAAGCRSPRSRDGSSRTVFRSIAVHYRTETAKGPPRPPASAPPCPAADRRYNGAMTPERRKGSCFSAPATPRAARCPRPSRGSTTPTSSSPSRPVRGRPASSIPSPSRRDRGARLRDGRRLLQVGGGVPRRQEFDLVVTVCDSAAADCPTWPGARHIVQLVRRGPELRARRRGPERLAAFRATRDDLRRRIDGLMEALRRSHPKRVDAALLADGRRHPRGRAAGRTASSSAACARRRPDKRGVAVGQFARRGRSHRAAGALGRRHRPLVARSDRRMLHPDYMECLERLAADALPRASPSDPLDAFRRLRADIVRFAEPFLTGKGIRSSSASSTQRKGANAPARQARRRR